MTERQPEPRALMAPASCRALLAALVVVLSAACADLTMAPDRRPASLEVWPDSVLRTVGDSVSFDVQVFDEAGEPYAWPSWAAPQWTSRDDSALVFAETGVGQVLRPGRTAAIVDVAGMTSDVVVRANPRELALDVAFAYVTQAVQRRQGDVPLVAGRPGLLRVYVTGGTHNYFEPSVRATFYRDGSAVHSETMAAGTESVPEWVDEGDRALAYEVGVPGSVIRPGTGLVIEVDPDGAVPASPGSELRVPATGALALDVVEVRPFRWRIVPVDLVGHGLEAGMDDSMAAEVTRMAHDVFPFSGFDVDVRAPFSTTENLSTREGWLRLLQDIRVLRLDDGSPRYYYGAFTLPPAKALRGMAYIGYPVSIGTDSVRSTIAHELGHNMTLLHPAGCSLSSGDADYPHDAALVGHYGWDQTADTLHEPHNTHDLMSYCRPRWVSDYHYEKVMEYRANSVYDAAFGEDGAGRAPASETDVLILQGGVFDGELRLEPALLSRTRPRLPNGGPYTLEGRDAGGAVLFSLSLTPQPLSHLPATSFAVAVPRELAQPERLAVLRLTGPEGTVERRRSPGPRSSPARLRVAAAAGSPFLEGRWDADAYPLAVVRDATTGRIVAMGRRGRVVLPADTATLDVALSDGIETHPTVVVPR